jgi:hypothetical protein
MQTRSQVKWIEIDIRVQQNVVYNASGFEKRDANSFVLVEGGQGSKYKVQTASFTTSCRSGSESFQRGIP